MANLRFYILPSRSLPIVIDLVSGRIVYAPIFGLRACSLLYFFRFRFREPGARRHIGMCKDVSIRLLCFLFERLSCACLCCLRARSLFYYVDLVSERIAYTLYLPSRRLAYASIFYIRARNLFYYSWSPNGLSMLLYFAS